MAYSSGPYSLFPALPSPPRPEVSTARKINFQFGTFAIDDTTGGFDAMSSTAQRVVILVAKNVKKPPNITPQSLLKIEQDVRSALSVLTKQPEPVIAIKTLTVEHVGYGAVQVNLRFSDLGTGEDNTVQLN